MLGLGIERRRWLVEHEDERAVAHETAGQRELLPLAEGDLDAVGPGGSKLCLEAGLQPRHDIVRPGPVYGAHDRGLVVEPGHVSESYGMPRPELEAEEVLEGTGQTLAPLVGPHPR